MIYFDETLVHRAENDGRFAAPAVRVAVMIILLMQQRMADAEFVQHGFVGVAFAVFFENGFTKHLGGHLLLDGQVVPVRLQNGCWYCSFASSSGLTGCSRHSVQPHFCATTRSRPRNKM